MTGQNSAARDAAQESDPRLAAMVREAARRFGALPVSRRKVLAASAIAAGSAVGATAVSGLGSSGVVSALRGMGGGSAAASTPSVNVTYAAGGAISDDNRLALRALWDAIVPGDWLGNQEDGGAPGADQTYVEAWLEQVAMSTPQPINWLSADFLNLWGADVNAWAQVNTLFMEEFYQLALGTSIVLPPTRQGKIILMMNLLIPGIETIFDLQYLGAIMLARLAFCGDFYFEANYPTVSVGRAYCGAHLPPGTTPWAVDSFNAVLGISNKNLITVNGLVNAP